MSMIISFFEKHTNFCHTVTCTFDRSAADSTFLRFGRHVVWMCTFDQYQYAQMNNRIHNKFLGLKFE